MSNVIRFPVERTPSGKIDAAIAEFERAREAYYAAKRAEAQNPLPHGDSL